MNAAQKKRRGKGFTIVELMVAMVAGSILALTSGLILVQGFQVWSRNTAATRIQRDGSLAIEMLQRKLREASGSDVVVDYNAVPLPTIQVTFPDGSTGLFEAEDVGGRTNLNYTVNGQTTVIASGTLRDFDILGASATAIRVRVSLEGAVRPNGGETERADFDATIHYRN